MIVRATLIRSLRWRLVLLMVLIIAAAVVAAGVFSTVRVTRELNQFLHAQSQAESRAALDVLAAGGPDALRRAYERSGRPILIINGEQRTVYPPELGSFDIRFRPDGTMSLTRMLDGRAESLMLKFAPRRIAGLGDVYVLPPLRRPEQAPFRAGRDLWLPAGLGMAVLLAVLVMLTIFRRVFAPVEALTAGARALAGGRLDARVPVRGEDEVAELGRAFNSMAEALERNERARRNMVSDVAHELRTPLTNIRVQLEGVQDGIIPADERFLQSLDEEAGALARLVDDLQQLSLAEAGVLRLELAEVRVAELVERAAAGFPAAVYPERSEGSLVHSGDAPHMARASRLHQRSLALGINFEPELTVRADGPRMVQVLRNLINNALVHAESRVEVRAMRVAEGVEIRVIDDGPGVPDEHVSRIFDRFYRVDDSRSRITGGAGLGLAIARQLVELHGGRIWYERPAFVIVLP